MQSLRSSDLERLRWSLVKLTHIHSAICVRMRVDRRLKRDLYKDVDHQMIPSEVINSLRARRVMEESCDAERAREENEA